MRALLVSRSAPFPKIHDIGELSLILPGDFRLPLTDHQQELLTDYATAGRYPGDGEPMSREEAEESVSMARAVRTAVRRLLPPESLEK